MKPVFCFIPEGTLYPGSDEEFDCQLLVYDADALERNEEADFDPLADLVNETTNNLYEDSEYCYTIKEESSEEEVRNELIAAGLVEMPNLHERLEELPI